MLFHKSLGYRLHRSSASKKGFHLYSGDNHYSEFHSSEGLAPIIVVWNICKTGFITAIPAAGGGGKAPDLLFSGLCDVIHESKLIAIGGSDISALEIFAVMRM